MSLAQLYEQCLERKQAGFKAEARRLAAELIKQYRIKPDRDFVYEICEGCTHKLDFTIWKEIVLPELASGLTDNPRAIRGMIRTVQNLYSEKSIWKELEHITEDHLTIRLLELSPGDVWARTKRVDQLRKWLAYTIHEWPTGVLYGAKGADEIFDAVRELRKLDEEGRFTTLCSDVEEKIARYKTRLAEAAG